MSLREAVFRADGGYCVQCHQQLSPFGDQWQWQAHHVLKQQWLKRFDVNAGDPNFAVLLCKRCHERHESRTVSIPREHLPMRVRSAVADLGDAAEDLLRRYHPPTEVTASTGYGPSTLDAPTNQKS